MLYSALTKSSSVVVVIVVILNSHRETVRVQKVMGVAGSYEEKGFLPVQSNEPHNLLSPGWRNLTRPSCTQLAISVPSFVNILW